MFSKARIRQDFNRAALHYDDHATLQRQVADRLFGIINGTWPHAAHILDAGAGTGYFQELARKYRHPWTIYQLDLAYNMCTVAGGYASLPEYGSTFTVNGESESLPFRDACVDGIFSSLMLQWVNKLQQVFAEFHRVLASGAYAYFSTLAPGTLYELQESFEQCGFRPPINQFRSAGHISALLGSAGFKEVVVNSQTLVLPYGSLLTLMHSLKGVGARYKPPIMHNPFIGRQGLEKIERYYKTHFGDTIPGTWEVLYITARK